MELEIAKKQKLSNKEIIIDLYEGNRTEEDLTEHQMEYLRIIRSAHGMALEVKSKSYIVGALMTQFDISQDKAYRLINDSGLIFGQISKVNKVEHQNIALEMAKASYRVALNKGDAMAMTAATKAYAAAAGLDKDDADLPDFSKLQPSLNVIVLPDHLQDQIEKDIKGGFVNLNKVETKDAEYEEISSEQHQRPD